MIKEMALEKHVFTCAKHGTNIPSNGGEKILNCIMFGYVFSPMNTNEAYPCQIYGLIAFALKKLLNCGMGEAQFSA